MSTATTDRIQKQVVLRAPRERVWRALTNAEEFGGWFGVDFTGGAFSPGGRIRGKVQHKGYEHLTMEITIERMEPQRLFSWRWHPGASPPGPDEPTTLVVFELEDTPEGTKLTVTESGFDRIPLPRRAEAFRDNEGGWTGQMKAIAKHLEQGE